MISEALIESRSIGERFWEAKLLCNLADVLSSRDRAKAEVTALEARSMALQLSDKRVVIDANYTLSRLLSEKENWDEAIKTAREGLTTARDSGHRLFVALGQMNIAQLLIGQANAASSSKKKRGLVEQEAVKVYNAAVETLRAMGAKWHLINALEEMLPLLKKVKRGDQHDLVKTELDELKAELARDDE